MEAPLSAILTRLQGLLADYPSHPVLLRVAHMASRVIKLPLTSPLMKVLTGVELLIQKAEGDFQVIFIL